MRHSRDYPATIAPFDLIAVRRRQDHRASKAMLQTIREKLTGWFAIIILGAIALTLVITFGNIDTGFTGASTAA
ncbi:MAG: hypothetical protein CMK67_04605, partial [Pseudoalteromonas sp.]|nr:hypothetical protein [Pseudoalteromonas sp.]